jgi:hypothetical protein
MGDLIMNFNLSVNQWVLIIILIAGLLICIPGVGEAVSVYIGIDYHLSEPVSIMLFGLSLVLVAGFVRKNLPRK